MANLPLTVLEAKAWGLAEFLHKDQIRKNSGGSYFKDHVAKVNGTVKLYTTNEDQLIGALLHDTFEDCLHHFEGSVINAYKYVELTFGKTIANIVLGLTTDKNILNTVFNGDKTNYLSFKMSKMDINVLEIKLCDRLRNLDDCLTADKKWSLKYVKSTITILDTINITENKHSKIAVQISNDIYTKCKNTLSILNKKK